MMKGIKFIIIFLLLQIIELSSVFAQESYFSIYADSISTLIPELNSNIDISVSNVDLQEFLRAVANSSKLNLSVDPVLDFTVTNNFHGVKVKDMLIFLEKNYPIKLEFIGNIINVSPRVVPEKFETELTGVEYDSLSNQITLDYYKASLTQVAREITKVTKYNIILAPSISDKIVNGYVENMQFAGALEQFAFSNDLKLRITETGYYVLEPIIPKQEENIQNPRTSRNSGAANSKNNKEEYILEVSRTREGELSIIAENAPLQEVIQKVSNELNVNYFSSAAIEGEASINTKGLTYESFLQDILKGTEFIYHKENDIFIIGSSTNSLLKECHVFQFQNRTLDKVIEIIPEDIKEGLVITEFPDLNSVLISGEKQRVSRLSNLLTEIDKTVPVILIEVFIVNVSRNYTISTGINAGIGDAPVATEGKLFPTIDLQLGSEAINKALEEFDGFGMLNLGNITPNFYLTLKLLEEQGVLDVSSTPKLSTLNGHEATMKIGETEYYLEETSNYIGSQNPSLSTSKVYKDITAELAITIKPIVSGDDQITLGISVEQSDFTERQSNEAPPGSVNRTFESIIRVKNQETIILGGLEEKRNQDSSSGTPWLSRIPILKWFFSSRTKQTQNTKLNIFIKPTIIG